MPANTTFRTPQETTRRSAAPVKSPTSMKQTSGRPGSRVMAARSVRPPVHSTAVVSPCAASTDTACSTLARQDAVENGRTMPVVPRIEMPPTMPSRALVVLRAIRSPPGTEMTTRTPAAVRSTASPTAWPIIARGTGLMAGVPGSRPRPGLVTIPTPTPPSSSIPGASRQVTVAVRWAPWVTSGSSPASLTTTASARSADSGRPAGAGRSAARGTSVQESTGKRTRCPDGSAISTVRCTSPVRRAVAAAFAAAAAHVPVVQPVRSAWPRTFAVRGRSGSRSSGPVMTAHHRARGRHRRARRGPRRGRAGHGANPARPGGSRGSAPGGTGASGCLRR